MYPYIDFHCDTLMMFAEPDRKVLANLYHDDSLTTFDGSDPAAAPGLYKNDGMIDLCRLKEGGCAAQFFATFMPPAKHMPEGMSDETYRSLLYNGLMKAVSDHGDMLAFARSYEDYEQNKKAGKVSAFLTFEDGRMVNGSFDQLKKYYELGYRLISLTWNFENCFGYPNSKDPDIMTKGLKNFGKEAISVMNDLGIIIDVSHLSDGGFYDVASLTKKPFVASHSCARALTSHTRNMTDDMLHLLGEKGGFVGVNFCPDFVEDVPGSNLSSVRRICDHVEYMANLAGMEAVGIGTDFDGIGGELEVAQPTDIYKLFDELSRRGWSDDQLEMFGTRNAERILKETL